MPPANSAWGALPCGDRDLAGFPCATCGDASLVEVLASCKSEPTISYGDGFRPEVEEERTCRSHTRDELLERPAPPFAATLDDDGEAMAVQITNETNQRSKDTVV